MEISHEDASELRGLLKRRLELIGDEERRENDPDGQLADLTEVGMALFALHKRLKGTLPPRLEHFMDGCSYDKALAFVEEQLGN